MKSKKRVTVAQAAKYLDVCMQRISAKIKQGHFPNHTWCECGHSILIPVSDLDRQPIDKRTIRYKKKNER